MEIKIEKQDHKPLVDRDEVLVKVFDGEATISNAQLKEDVAKKLNKSQDLIIVKQIRQKFGKHEAEAKVYVYQNAEALARFEPKKKEKKEAVKKEEKK